MALALSFAGNDLVNFIGVFMAGQSSMEIAAAAAAQGADLTTLSMGGLMAPVTADWRYLLGAGVIMVLALMFSKRRKPLRIRKSIWRGRAGSRAVRLRPPGPHGGALCPECFPRGGKNHALLRREVY